MSSNLKKIRDFERMIKRFGSSPELEAKLADAKQGKVLVTKKERTRKNSTKYHMVRFLERKKVTRKVRSLESKLKSASAAESVDLNKQRDSLLNDLAYIMYYPMEHKYIALFPGKDDKESDSENEDGAKMSEQKSKTISLKARELALQRWADDKQRLTDGIEGGGDKVAYAMEVEYKGGAAAAENAPGRTAAMDAKQDHRAEQAGKTSTAKAATKTVTTKLGSKHTTFSATADTTAHSSKTPTTQAKNNASNSDSSDSESSSDSSESDSDSSGSDSDSGDEAPKTAKSNKPTPKKAETAKVPTSAVGVASAAQDEASDNDGDDFFVEEASESELVNAATAPKVYNDGNNFRFKEERKSVHEIRFAATKRKYERHKRVFNNQNKRGANDRGSKKQRS